MVRGKGVVVAEEPRVCGEAKNVVIHRSRAKELRNTHLHIWEWEEVAVVPEKESP